MSREGRMLAAVAGSAVLALILGSVALARATLPVTGSIQESLLGTGEVAALGPILDARSKVFAADGTLIAILHGEENREPIPLARIPAHVRRAVIAIEDERFYSHDGVDVAALGRALIVNSTSGSVEQGGGTITMQLARNAYMHERRKTLSRKLQEIALARAIEKRFSKDQILEQYLNSVYFGWGAYGIQAAAEAYFGTSVERLTLGQAALLAGVIRSPARLDPRRDPKETLARRDYVLLRMEQLEYVTAAQRRVAGRQHVTFQTPKRSNGVVMVADAGASFVEFVKQQLLGDTRLGATREERSAKVFSGGLRITTTLDLAAQRAAERSIRDVLDRKDDPSAALASVEPGTGAIRAMAGGTDARGFNLAAQGRRQPGSAFKAFALVAALEDGISVQKTYNGSSPRLIRLHGGGTWLVHNYEGSRGGRMSLVTATEHSVNAVYAQLVVDIGPEKIVGVANRMGITSHLDPYPSISLGALTVGVSPLEMASGYSTLAARGVAVSPYSIQKVLDPQGSVILGDETARPRQVLDPGIANTAAAVLQQVVKNGTGKRALGLGRPVAGKTGTTDDYRDSWFVGFTPQLSTAVWIGYPTVSKPLANIHGLPYVFGGSLPAEIWTRFMSAALAGEPVLDFPKVSLGAPEYRSPETTREPPVITEFRRRRRKH